MDAVGLYNSVRNKCRTMSQDELREYALDSIQLAPAAVRPVLLRAYNLGEKMGQLGMGLMIGVIFVAIAFGVFYGTNTTGWDPVVVAIWGYIPEIAVAVFIAALAAYAWSKQSSY